MRSSIFKTDFIPLHAIVGRGEGRHGIRKQKKKNNNNNSKKRKEHAFVGGRLTNVQWVLTANSRAATPVAAT